jgi:3-hydroxyisobutyrate dehydrogenase-like beta-hydroxyacid dehydrogenase
VRSPPEFQLAIEEDSHVTARTTNANNVRWLIVGHGSVGSAIARRVSRARDQVWVLDPSPRVPVTDGRHVTSLEGAPTFDYVVSCVFPSEAPFVPKAVRTVLTDRSVYFDWNTVAPQAKQKIAALSSCEVIDVALLDTLDEDSSRPTLAISGHTAADAQIVLRRLGFHVDVVGPECGEGARLKFARSLFMKGLEALVVEFQAATSDLAAREIVVQSIEKNLGERFTEFARLLVQTDRLHAARRSVELAQAIEVFAGEGHPVRLAEAAVAVLRGAATAWASPNSPPPTADVDELVAYLSQNL